MVTSACWAGPWTAGRLRAPGVGTARGHGAGFQGAPPPAPCPCGVGGSISREGCGPSPAEGSPQTPCPGEGCVQSEPSTARVGGPAQMQAQDARTLTGLAGGSCLMGAPVTGRVSWGLRFSPAGPTAKKPQFLLFCHLQSPLHTVAAAVTSSFVLALTSPLPGSLP